MQMVEEVGGTIEWVRDKLNGFPRQSVILAHYLMRSGVSLLGSYLKTKLLI